MTNAANTKASLAIRRANELAPNSNFKIEGFEGMKLHQLAQAIIEQIDAAVAEQAERAAIQPAGEAVAAQVCLSEQKDEWSLITLADCERMRRLGIPVRLLYTSPVSAPVPEAKAEQGEIRVFGNTGDGVLVIPAAPAVKHEASAANQQAGEVGVRKAQDLLPKLHSLFNRLRNPENIRIKSEEDSRTVGEASALCRTLINASRLAAPISEGTGKQAAEKAGGHAQAIEALRRIREAGNNTTCWATWAQKTAAWGMQTGYCPEQPAEAPEERPTAVMAEAAPAASNGDALPKSEPTIAELEHAVWCAEVNLDGAREHLAERLRAARAGTGSAGSIGGDAEFMALAHVYRQYHKHDDYQALVDYIDRWADTRATKVEAAPGNAGEGVA